MHYKGIHMHISGFSNDDFMTDDAGFFATGDTAIGSLPVLHYDFGRVPSL